MTATVFELFGSIGLFLLGMVLLTDALKSFAGHALRKTMKLAALRRQERPLVLNTLCVIEGETADKHRGPALALQMLDSMR